MQLQVQEKDVSMQQLQNKLRSQQLDLDAHRDQLRDTEARAVHISHGHISDTICSQAKHKRKGISEDIEAIKVRRALAEKSAEIDAMQV